jgi:hypothetical protein
MKKKVVTTSKIRPKKKQKTLVKMTMKPTGKKVTVGEDEFCPKCMEWRAFDEATGKCLVCGHHIRKVGMRSHTITDEYDLKDFTIEHDEPQETPEN